ncbi:MAG: hypothetical protein GY814_13965 [Gammaproteobacteria bacterium]|nr:hypothetical protein [Gammaproteobacteria bacterium]
MITTIARRLNTLKNRLISTGSLMVANLYFASIAVAQDIKIPSYIKTIDSSKLEDAGKEINMWIYALLVVIIAASAIRPAFAFVQGKREEAIEHSKDIIYGVVFAVGFGSVVFVIMGKFI